MALTLGFAEFTLVHLTALADSIVTDSTIFAVRLAFLDLELVESLDYHV